MTDTTTNAAFDAEQALLGALISDRDAIADVVERLTPDAFSTADHRATYAAISDLWSRRVPVDVVTLAAELAKRSVAVDYVRMCDWLLACPIGCHARYYADIVIDAARQRLIADAGADLVKRSMNGGADPEVELMLLRERLDKLGAVASTGPQLYEETIPFWRQDLEAQWRGLRPRTETPTGFSTLDRIFSGGFRPGELVVLGARSGMGKTAFMLQLAHNAARYRRDHQVLVFSLEMSKESLFARAASEISGLSYLAVKREGLDKRHQDAIMDATGVMESLPVAVDDESGLTTAQMQVRLEKAQLHQPVSLVVIDYLEIVGDKVSGDSDERKVAEISRRAKHLARVCNVPVVLLSQLSREVERRVGNIPKLSDLRYSGAIEANADIVILLYRYDYYVSQGVAEPDPAKAGQANVIIAKHRNGPTPTIAMRFLEETMTFQEFGP